MYFLIEDGELLEKYNTMWDKVTASIKKEFDSQRTIWKQKSHGGKVTDVYDNKNRKLDSRYTCLAVISFDSTLKKDDHCYPPVFLEMCKYIEKKVIRHIIDNLCLQKMWFWWKID